MTIGGGKHNILTVYPNKQMHHFPKFPASSFGHDFFDLVYRHIIKLKKNMRCLPRKHKKVRRKIMSSNILKQQNTHICTC